MEEGWDASSEVQILGDSKGGGQPMAISYLEDFCLDYDSAPRALIVQPMAIDSPSFPNAGEGKVISQCSS